ncbi:MAG: sodium:alanine symporter family protein [Bacteroidales bacterium]|nr:sodium:alanine symporter family protein [Bacteroidales bacterium]
MDLIQNFFSELSSFLWGWPMIILLFGTHIYMTVRLRFPQLKILKAIKLSFVKYDKSKRDVSQFGALMTVMAATIGIRNIIGVGTAVSLGGPGAVLWCWLTGVLGIATKYSEGLLAVKYRQKTEDGKMLGGPMYALEKGLGMKWLAILFCAFTVFASFGIGNGVQSKAIADCLSASYQIPHYITGIVLVVLVILVIFFGVKGIAKVCGRLVPFMAIFYIVGCIAILIMNWHFLDDALILIFKSAFSPHAAGAGFVGGTVMMAARFGIARGLFSNESGLGSAPIIAAAAQTRNSVRQALVSSTGTFWDTVVVCALTGLVIVSSVVAFPDIDASKTALLTQAAFAKLPYVGSLLLNISIITFAFSTILGWSYYGEKAIEYLGGKKTIKYYRLTWVVVVFIGAVINLNLVWNISDTMNALMAIPNLISVLLLSGVIVKETKKYLWNNRLDDYDPECEL